MATKSVGRAPSGATDLVRLGDLPGAAASDLFWFGDGSDGDASYSSGTVTLTRDTYFRNLTLSGSAVVDTAGYRLHALGTLDISGLTSGWIGRAPLAGTDATSSTAPAATTALASGTVGGGVVGVAGGSGGTAAGNKAIVGAGAPAAAGAGNTGSGGAGGAGPSGSGGTSTAQTLLGPITRYRRSAIDLLRGNTPIVGCAAQTPGGSGGGGDGTNRGGAGGSGGGSGAVVAIYARTIIRGVSTGAAAVRARGAKGGAGYGPTTGNVGGGGGGAGGGGGWVTIVYRYLTGSAAANAIDVSGGDGGNGANGNGTGTAGRGGGAGWGGFVSQFDLTAGTGAFYLGPQSNADPSGQAGETAAVSQTSL